MSASPGFLDHLIDMLAPLGPVAVRRMFGGAGLFRDGLMFALVADDTLHLKADDGNRAAFEAAGMRPFGYEAAGRRLEIAYYEAPAETLDDADALLSWARGAWQAAVRANSEKRRKTGGR